MENTIQNNPLKQSDAMVNETDNTVKQIPLFENVKKFNYFDYTEGKKFSANLWLKIIFWFLGLHLLAFAILSMPFLGTINIYLIIQIILSLLIISFSFQKTEVGCDGIKIVSLKYIIPYKTFIKWEDIEDITLSKNTVKGTSYITNFITVSGKKEYVNLSAMNETNEMIHNLILAYFNYSRNKNFDWSQVMCAPA